MTLRVFWILKKNVKKRILELWWCLQPPIARVKLNIFFSLIFRQFLRKKHKNVIFKEKLLRLIIIGIVQANCLHKQAFLQATD